MTEFVALIESLSSVMFLYACVSGLSDASYKYNLLTYLESMICDFGQVNSNQELTDVETYFAFHDL